MFILNVGKVERTEVSVCVSTPPSSDRFSYSWLWSTLALTVSTEATDVQTCCLRGPANQKKLGMDLVFLCLWQMMHCTRAQWEIIKDSLDGESCNAPSVDSSLEKVKLETSLKVTSQMTLSQDVWTCRSEPTLRFLGSLNTCCSSQSHKLKNL